MKKAFTLLEIVIVVMIIAILAGIAIPNLLKAKNASGNKSHHWHQNRER